MDSQALRVRAGTPDCPVVQDKKVHRFSREFVLRSLRHTALTRTGEAGADAFTIMKVAGHSRVRVSRRCAHPTVETVQLALDRLETLHLLALETSFGKRKLCF